MKTLKLLSSACVACALALPISACGGASNSSEGKSNDPNTLTVWAWDPSFNIKAMEEAEKIYQREHPDFRLDIKEVPWDDVQTKTTTIAQSKKLDGLPDIFLMQNYAFQKNLLNYPELFSDYEESDVDFSQFPESVVDYSLADGKHYGLPFDSGTAIAAYRTDYLTKAGLTIDDFTDITWGKFLENAKKVKSATGKPLLSAVAGDSDMLGILLQSAGASLFDDSGNPVVEDNKVLKKAMEMYAELVQEGLLTEVNSWDEYIGSFVNDNVAGVINGVWVLGSIQTATEQEGNWGLTNIPKLEGILEATNYSANGGSSWAISSNANVELAQDFLASTFAGSTELFDSILQSSGAVANWIPAGGSEEYNKPNNFFGGQPIFNKVVDFGTKVLPVNTGVYFYEGRDAISSAQTQVIQGTPIDTALKEAQETLEYQVS